MPTIWDIGQFEALGPIARRFGITFKLRGGVAFRLVVARHTLNTWTNPLDLFELTPFTSDVDLMHSGPSNLTPAILDEILADVPAAECFRWELHSEQEVRRTFSAQAKSNLIPARLVEVGMQAPDGLLDPTGGADDIRNGKGPCV